MHILIVNDDGPPSTKASPYILALVRSLQAAGHTVSVILPHVQRSWIGKAHFIGQLITPTYYQPPESTQDIEGGTTHEFPLPASAQAEEWILVDGTPATCAQLGLNHFFKDRGPVDLVISGPNYGRNSTSLFALSSGTLGGAMEAAACKKRAIAVSYAFFTREIDPVVLTAAAGLSVKVIEYLAKNWGADVEVYSVNVPLVSGVDKSKIYFTNLLENYWTEGSGAFDEVEVEQQQPEEGKSAEDVEQKTREGTASRGPEVSPTQRNGIAHSRHTHRHFKWAPKFADVQKSVEQSKPGNDGWAVRQGYVSITPLRATFTAAKSHRYGEVNLNSAASYQEQDTSGSLPMLSFYAHVVYEDQYVQPLILEALQTTLKPGSFLLVDALDSESLYLSKTTRFLQISQYESLPHETLLDSPTMHYGNSYIIRKALIRKHYLSHTIAAWTAKNPESLLKDHTPTTLDFELDYAEFLDDALVEAWEVKQAWERNETAGPLDREWWILKPSMSDKGQGIRLFSSQEELQEIFDQWEEENPSNGEDEDTHSSQDHKVNQDEDNDTGLMTSQLRHFVIQPYIAPLLLPSLGNRKFHIRSYVLAVGALKVYVYADMLALFSDKAYTVPGHDEDPNANLSAHLTNTFLQSRDNSVPDPTFSTAIVHALSSLPSAQINHQDWSPESALRQILPLTSALFRAAAAQPTNFQPLPNCFEVYGLDWLVDDQGKVWLLEVNAFPDFRQTGEGLADRLVGGFWKGVVRTVCHEWFAGSVKEDLDSDAEDRQVEVIDIENADYVGGGMYKVLDLDMGRR